MPEPAVRGLHIPTRTAEDVFRDVLIAAVSAIERAQIQHVVIGGVGSAALGRPRWTHDIDIFVTPVDADRALDALRVAGFETDRTNTHWIYKATMDDIVVDLIFKSMGDVYLDEQMLARARRTEFLGVALTIAPPEDQIIIKSIAHDEQSARHWNDALALIASTEIDWDYLLERASKGPRRVLSLLVYAQSNDLVVPDAVIGRLFEQVYHPDGAAT